MTDATRSATDQRIPVIDIGGLRSGDPAALAALGDEIGKAARDTGFFTIVNHGIAPELIAGVFAQARRFFSLPGAEKQRVALAKSANFRGYVEIGYEQLDPAHPGDAKESFEFALELTPDDPRYDQPMLGPNYWPELPGFREALLDYQSAVRRLTIDLHRPIAVDLGLAADFFTPFVDPGLSNTRILRYPPHPGTFDGKQYGAAPHTDYGVLTLLAQEDVSGLELRTSSGEWLPVMPPPGGFICNIGDCLMRWSNHTYVSTLHRVVNRTPRDRYSVAFFGDPNPEAVIEVLPSRLAPGEAPRYAPTSYADYFRSRTEPVFPLKPRA
jgi:isopenicillin N synthase-like dioxygenase